MKKLIVLVASLSLALTTLVHALLPIDYNLSNAVDHAPIVTIEAYSLTEKKAVDVEGNYIYADDDDITFDRGYYYELGFKNDKMVKAVKINNKVVKNYE